MDRCETIELVSKAGAGEKWVGRNGGISVYSNKVWSKRDAENTSTKSRQEQEMVQM